MDSMQAKMSREQAAKAVRSWTNLERIPGKPYWTGYGGGMVWHCHPQRDKHGKAYAWDCYAQNVGVMPAGFTAYFRLSKLRDVANRLASLKGG